MGGEKGGEEEALIFLIVVVSGLPVMFSIHRACSSHISRFLLP